MLLNAWVTVRGKLKGEFEAKSSLTALCLGCMLAGVLRHQECMAFLGIDSTDVVFAKLINKL